MQLLLYRFMEIEADDVGLVLAAKACLDVRKAPEFWSKMSLNRDDALQNEVKTFMVRLGCLIRILKLIFIPCNYLK